MPGARLLRCPAQAGRAPTVGCAPIVDQRPLPVYLIHWDAPGWCARACASILASEGVTVDLAVIDNGQRGGEPLASTLPPGVRVLAQEANRGYTGGANAALDDWAASHPDADLCVIGSHDLHVEPGTLGRLVDLAERRPDAGVVAPRLTAPHRAAGGVWNGRRSEQVDPPDDPEVVRRDWASGTCLVLRRTCVDAVGRFDEDLGSYMEDVDYGLRVGDAGWSVLVDRAAVAWGLGTASDTAIGRIAANSVVLAAKRRGRRGAVAGLGLFTWWTVKGYASSWAPWRPASRRAVARRYASQRASALLELVRSGRLRTTLTRSGG